MASVGRSGVGFVEGVLSIFRGLAFIARTPRARWLSLVPALALVFLSGLGIFVALRTVTPAIAERLPLSASALGRVGAGALRVVVFIVTATTSVLLAAWLTPLVSGPALERIVVLRERDLALPERPKVSFFREVYSGLAAQLLATAVGAPVMAALWGVTFAFPPAAVVTLPLKFVTALVLLVWCLIDYPLSLRGVPLRDRLSFLGREAPALLGFGGGVLLLFAIPLGAIVLLPAAVAAATEITARC